ESVAAEYAALRAPPRDRALLTEIMNAMEKAHGADDSPPRHISTWNCTMPLVRAAQYCAAVDTLRSLLPALEATVYSTIAA
ncbi:FCD domain-containing protein, partial [Brucella abortus]|nr:FCD domain-containing protein [Brucella abortus]